MRNVIISMAIGASLAIVSCNKEAVEESLTGDYFSNETETFTLAESGFTISETTPLAGLENDRYTEGVLEYSIDGEVLAVFDYAADTDADHGRLIKDEEEKECDLERMDEAGEKDCKGKKKGKRKFKKVIIEPIVKTEDCDYIVSGIFKLFDMKTGEWVATIDFGDGTCDDLATKTTAEGVTEFNLSEFKK